MRSGVRGDKPRSLHRIQRAHIDRAVLGVGGNSEEEIVTPVGQKDRSKMFGFLSALVQRSNRLRLPTYVQDAIKKARARKYDLPAAIPVAGSKGFRNVHNVSGIPSGYAGFFQFTLFEEGELLVVGLPKRVVHSVSDKKRPFRDGIQSDQIHPVGAAPARQEP